VSNLPSKLDEIAAHYSACERQQTIYAAAREIESLTTEMDRLREALEFYSNQKDWDEYEYDVIDQVYDRNVGSKLGHDAGKIARETLKGA